MEHGWAKHFAWQSVEDPMCGYVHTASEVSSVIREFEIETHSKFKVQKVTTTYGQNVKDLKTWKGDLHWRDTQRDAKPSIQFDGTPFVILGRKTFECHHGPDRGKNQRKRFAESQESRMEADHTFNKRRRMIQSTKKLNCPAQIKVRHIIKLPEYNYSGPYQKSAVLDDIATKVRNDSTKRDIKYEHRFYMQLSNAHENHLRGSAADLVQPIDKKLVEYIHKMVLEHNIMSAVQLKTLLAVYLKQEPELFKDKPLPSRSNSRFWPTLQQIRNHMLLATMRSRSSAIDQGNVETLIEKWKRESPLDHFSIRSKTSNDAVENLSLDDEDENSIDDDNVLINITADSAKKLMGKSSTFLFVHQTAWQQRMLGIYGNEICLLDATYRTTKYVLPLFFIVVPTNVNYIVVATFITEAEDKGSISEALQYIRSWNPMWYPRYFMCDFAEEEIGAVESTFQDCQTFVYLCDFHREQAWHRWLSATHNGADTSKAEIKLLLRSIASADSEEIFQNSVKQLKSSSFWTGNPKLQRWFQTKWLNNSKRWVRAYRQDRFNVNVNTNNGIERQNKTLKYSYLWGTGDKPKTISQLLVIIVDKFLPDSHVRYLRENIKSSDLARRYSSDIPPFLHNRPSNVVCHIKRRWEEATIMSSMAIDEVCYGQFLVKSQTLNGRLYLVDFCPDGEMPHCDCPDWSRHHMPCKHMCCVMMSPNHPNWTWDSLPSPYRLSPYLTLDAECLNQPSLDYGASAVDDVLEISDDNCMTNSYLPKPSMSAIKIASDRLRASLEQLKDWSHRINDAEALDALNLNLDKIKQVAKEYLPMDEDMILEPYHHDNVIHSNQRNHKKYESLKCRRRRKAVKTADINIGELICENEELHISSNVSSKIEDTMKIEADMAAPKVKRQRHHHQPVTSRDHLEVNDVWRDPDDVIYLHSIVSGIPLFSEDFRSLKGRSWMTDAVIDAYIALICVEQREKGNQIYQFPVQTMSNICWEGKFNDASNKLYVSKMKNLRRMIMIVGCVNIGHHWTLVVAHPQSGELYFYNSLGETDAQLKKIIQNWNAYWTQRLISKKERDDITWNVKTNVHKKQMDSHNCGVFTLMFAEAHVSRLPDNKKLRLGVGTYWTMRRTIGQVLLSASDDLNSYCRSCGLKIILESNTDVSHCQICGGFFDFKCQTIEEKQSLAVSGCRRCSRLP